MAGSSPIQSSSGLIFICLVHQRICGDGSVPRYTSNQWSKPLIGVQSCDGLAEDDLEPVEVLVGLGELGAGVAEEVLHVRHLVAQVDGEGAGVLAARDSTDVSHRSHASAAPRSGSASLYVDAPSLVDARCRLVKSAAARRPRSRSRASASELTSPSPDSISPR